MLDLVRSSELETARRWVSEAFGLPMDGRSQTLSDRFPVSFRYGEAPPSGGGPAEARSSLNAWSVRRTPAQSEAAGTGERVAEAFSLVLTHPHTGLECRCEIKVYVDFPGVEWVVYFKNIGETDTPLLSDIQPLDLLVSCDAQTACRVHHARGGLTQTDDFAPLETPLTFRQGGSTLQLTAGTGKSSTLHLPFFNLELDHADTGGKTTGIIGAIGWTGGWLARFQRQVEGVRVRAGMERTHLRLHPGEEIRTPRILLLFWEEDRQRSQNMLRRLILAHYTPRSNGQLLQPPFCDGVWGARSEASHLEKIAWLRDNGIPVECYWIDAGWYGNGSTAQADDVFTNAWAKEAGTWSPNSAIYPQGLKPVGDAARAAGMGFLLWVEPERAFEGTALARQHPEWLLGPVPAPALNGDNYMINLGLPEARQAITDLVSELIRSAGVTCYRQDFNFLLVPALFGGADAADRVGMAEIRHIEGLYAFWDELLARHPGLIIDNCAGGGQRIDLETISRSVPLWRSDLQCWPFDPLAMQTQTQGLAPWVPLSVGVCEAASTYALRSALGPGLVTHWSSQALEAGANFSVSQIRQLMAEAAAMRPYFYGDYYPLLTFSLAADAWAAWQYDRPDLGEGMVVAFRRHACPFPSWQAKLKALDLKADYELYSGDDHRTRRVSGQALMTEGLFIATDEQPGSVLFVYKHVK
jgi:alpha-galactosidase